MRTFRFHAFWVLVLLTVVWASELAGPSPSGVTTETIIPLPSPIARQAAVALPAAAPFAAAPINTDTCFEREAEFRTAADEYALGGDFAAGIESFPLIPALYVQRSGVIWDYAERCNTAEYYKQAKTVKKLRTASLASEASYDWRRGTHTGGGSGHSSGDAPFKGGPNVFDFSHNGGGGSFGGGSGGSGGPGGNGGGGGPGLIGDNGQGDHLGDGKNPPGGDPGDPPRGGDGHENPDPGSGGPGNPPAGDGGATILPEPGSLALFLGLMVGFGLMRRRVSSI